MKIFKTEDFIFREEEEKREFGILVNIIHEFERQYLFALGYHEPCSFKCKYCNAQCLPIEKTPINVYVKRKKLAEAISKSLSYNRINELICLLEKSK